MSDDDFIYGICREPECHYVWRKEPEEPVTCPRCGTPGWPMTPAEAQARFRNFHRVGRPCSKPGCQGTLRVCAQCSEGQTIRQLECTHCHHHVEESVRVHASTAQEYLQDQRKQEDRWEDRRREREQEELDRAAEETRLRAEQEAGISDAG